MITASEMGKKGGSSRSDAKVAAVRKSIEKARAKMVENAKKRRMENNKIPEDWTK